MVQYRHHWATTASYPTVVFMHPVTFTFEFVSLFLIATGAFLVLVELRTRYDRSFLFSGISLILLGLLTTIDVWVLPGLTVPSDVLYWTRVYHLMACAAMVFLTWYFMALTDRVSVTVLKILGLAAMACGMLFFTDLFLRISDGKVCTTAYYDAIFAPFGVLAVLLMVRIIVRGLKTGIDAHRSVLALHLAGLVCLFVFAMIDMIVLATLGNGALVIPSFTVLGLLCFGVMMSVVFTERFLQLVRERHDAYSKLTAAYQEMEQASSLRQLGESMAIISHEMRNRMFAISGSAEMLVRKELVVGEGKRYAEGIAKAAQKLNSFSEDILQMSRSRIVRDKSPVDVVALIHGCIDEHFAQRREHFVWQGGEGPVMMHGDWAKLEHVFLNLFKNAFEAEAQRITIRNVTRNGVLVLAVEDDGIGCNDPEHFSKLFTAFHTTKKEKLGTGLGMSISRAIVESHGGHISVYNRNMLGNSAHGLRLEMTFPQYNESVADAAAHQDNLALVKEGIANLAAVIRVLQNVNVSPYVFQTLADMKGNALADPNLVVLLAAQMVAEVNRRRDSVRSDIALISCDGPSVYVCRPRGNGVPEMLSEEYVLTHLMHA
jgi:signal transduction histidine kinase